MDIFKNVQNGKPEIFFEILILFFSLVTKMLLNISNISKNVGVFFSQIFKNMGYQGYKKMPKKCPK